MLVFIKRNNMRYSIKLKNRYPDLLKQLNKPRSKSIQYGSGIIKFIKHKINMRKLNKVKRKIDKTAIPLEKMLDLGKEQHAKMLYFVNELVNKFNSVIDTRQRIEILKIRRIEESAKTDFAVRDIVDYELTKGRRNLAELDNGITELIDNTQRQMEFNEKYLVKMREAKDKFIESIKDSEIILEYKNRANLIQNLDIKLEGLSRVSKEAKALRKEAEILKQDFDNLQKLGYQFLQEKSQIVNNLLSLNAQVSELITFYNKLTTQQKENVKTLELWRENVEDFYKILNFIGVDSEKKIIDGLTDIIKYINILVEIYKRANDEKLNTNYVSIFIEYKTQFEKFKTINVKKSVELIKAIKDEYFSQTRVTPIQNFIPRIDSIIQAMNNVFMTLLWFLNFMKFYKDSKFNDKLSEFVPKREVNLGRLVELSNPESQSGGGASDMRIMWGTFQSEMNKNISESISESASTENKMNSMVKTIQSFIYSTLKSEFAKFNSYYRGANPSAVRNKIGYFKRENERTTKYTYYNVYNEETKSFTKSETATAIEIDIAFKPKIKTEDLQFPAVIHVKDNLYLYYPGRILQFYKPNASMKNDAKLYLFFCYVFEQQDITQLTEHSNILLLDIYTGYPIIHPGRDHMTLLDEQFIYKVLFESNKDENAQKGFVNEIATSILVKRYNSLQLVEQDYCDILDETNDEAHFMSKFRDNVQENLLTSQPHEPMYPHNEWNIGVYRHIPITITSDKDLDDEIASIDKKAKESVEKVDIETIKENINKINQTYITNVLFNPNFPISIDPELKTFITVNNVGELEDKIMERAKGLLEGAKRRSSSKLKTMQQRRLSELKSTAFMDNLYLLSPAVQQILIRETAFTTFKEKTTKDIKMLEYDFSSTKEERTQALNPELAFEVANAAVDKPNLKIMEKLVGKISIQDRFDEYMKTYDDQMGTSLNLNFPDILPALKKLSKTEYTNFLNINFYDAKPLYDRKLFEVFFTRLAHVSDAVKSDLSDNWFNQHGFTDNGLIKTISHYAELSKRKKDQQKKNFNLAENTSGVIGAVVVTGGRRTRTRQHKISSNRKLTRKH